MRPLKALTPRGVGLLAFGVLVGAAGFVVGQRELVALGLLLLLAPALSALTVLGSGRRVVHSRTLQPARVAVGSDARVLLRVGNASPAWPVAGLLVEDGLPVPLGQEPRYNIGYLRPLAMRDMAYRVRPRLRGSFPLGPLRVGVADPLGCVRVQHLLGAPSSLLVTPATVPLDPPASSHGSPGGEGRPPRPVTGSGEDDPIPREYRHGDDLRRVHWRSSARHGELMVRREEHQWREHSVLLLDLRRGAHGGDGPDSSLETGVGAAASLCLHLLDRGHELRLVTEQARLPAADGPGVLDALAVALPSDAPALYGGIGRLRASQRSGSGTAVAVLGAVRPEEAAALAQAHGARPGAAEHVAVLCRHAAWTPEAPIERAREVLSRAGWAVLVIGSVAELAQAWRYTVARPAGRRTRQRAPGGTS